MEILWAPWRIEYIKKGKPSDCIFCIKPREEKDKENYILFRGQYSFVIMNAYPYNNGHLMVCPYEHIDSLEGLNDHIMLDLMRVTNRCTEILRKAFRPEGFNLGVNIGRVAGAGVDGHVHIHIVPRWNGDTNFMPVLSETRVMPEHLESTYETLLPYFLEK